MTDKEKTDKAPVEKVEFTLADFLEEVNTVIWEKAETAKREAGRHNTPMAGLTNLRVDRLKALLFYLQKIENFQKGKPAPKEKPDDGMLAIERAAIGPLFTGSRTALDLTFDLKPGYFRDRVHGKIFEVAYEMVRMGKNVDVERLRTFIPYEGHAVLDAFDIKFVIAESGTEDVAIEAKFEYSGPHNPDDITIRETPIEEASDIEFTTEAPARDDGWED